MITINNFSKSQNDKVTSEQSKKIGLKFEKLLLQHQLYIRSHLALDVFPLCTANEYLFFFLGVLVISFF
jgi:hypothetical protein